MTTEKEHEESLVSEDTSQRQFGLAASVHYIKWAYTFMEQYYSYKGKNLGDRDLPRIVIDQLKKLNGQIYDLSQSNQGKTPEEQVAAIAEFSYQNRAQIPHYLGSALILARAVAADDESIQPGSGESDVDDVDQKQLTKINFTRLANGLSASLDYFGEMHALRPMAGSRYNIGFSSVNTSVSSTIPRMNMSTSALVYGNKLRTNGQGVPDAQTNALGPRRIKDDFGFPAMADASDELLRRYYRGFEKGVASRQPALLTQTQHVRISDIAADGLPGH